MLYYVVKILRNRVLPLLAYLYIENSCRLLNMDLYDSEILKVGL